MTQAEVRNDKVGKLTFLKGVILVWKVGCEDMGMFKKRSGLGVTFSASLAGVCHSFFFFYLMPDFLSLTSSSLLLFSLRAFCHLIMTNGHQRKSLKFKCRFSYLVSNILIAVISSLETVDEYKCSDFINKFTFESKNRQVWCFNVRTIDVIIRTHHMHAAGKNVDNIYLHDCECMHLIVYM